MASQDTLRYIQQVTSRGMGHPSLSKAEIDRLSDAWEGSLKDQPLAAQLVPARIVTVLEVFFRDWVERLIDHGPPYLERAAALKLDLKFDYALANNLRGGIVTLGQLVAHTIPTSRLESIKAAFDTLVADDIFVRVSQVSKRWDVEVLGKSPDPIIPNMDQLKRDLFKLFEVRHILVHELPKEPAASLEDVSSFLRSLHGKFPLTQRAMNAAAAEGNEVALEELSNVCSEIAKQYGSYGSELAAVQETWDQFRNADAEWRSREAHGGSMQPMLYSMASEGLARARTKELKEWLAKGGL